MTRVPSARSRTWVWIGLALAIVHLLVLATIALFDGPRFAEDFLETLPWLAIIGVPAVLAGAGLEHPAMLPWAAGISLPLSLVSLAGATLPLLLPALCYVLGYAASSRAMPDTR